MLEIARSWSGIVGELKMTTATLQTSIEPRAERKPPSFVPGGAALRADDIRRGRVLPAALKLLEAAGEVLHHDQAEARRCIAEAVALLLTADVLKGAGRRETTAEPTRGGLAPWQISRVAEYVGANIARAIRIEDLAAVTRLSTGHFRHAFRRSTGESPYAYVLRRRLERAQHLMVMTENSLSGIALECGFTDQPHLTRLFHRSHPGGVAPAAAPRTRQDRHHADRADQSRRMTIGGRAAPAASRPLTPGRQIGIEPALLHSTAAVTLRRYCRGVMENQRCAARKKLP